MRNTKLSAAVASRARQDDSISEPRATFAGNEWLSYAPGTIWILDGAEVAIDRVSGLNQVIVRRLATQEVVEADRAMLAPAPAQRVREAHQVQLESVDTPEMAAAKAKEAALGAYVDGTPLSRADRESLAACFSVDCSTIKRWLRQYRAMRHWSVFLPGKPGWIAGQTRLDAATEAIITAQIKAQAEVDQYFTAATIIETIRQRCEAAGLAPPTEKSVRPRVKAHFDKLKNLPEDIRREEQRSRRLVRGKLIVDGPLDVVQVDHTPIDLPVKCLVTNRTLGCPYITIVFTVQPRIVLGFYLTLESPSQLSTALALQHAVFPKEGWLAHRGIEGPWPFYGIMRVLHTDNAGEFVSPHYKRAALRWNIQTALRRKGEPQDGGHIERYLGTLNGRIHGQKGAMRFRQRRRGRKPPKAYHTLSSLEKFIANEIIAYHHERHSELGMSPAQAWEQAWMTQQGLQLPCFPRDEREFLITFLPGDSRVVSREGIAWNCLQYRCPELEPFIRREKRQFFRFDPRDISRIYFETGEGPFLEVPWTEVNYPRLSRWEWNELRATLRTRRRPADGRIVHLARQSNRELNLQLQARSQRARRRLAREDGWMQVLPNAAAEPRAPLAVTVTSSGGPLEFEILE